MGFTQEISKNKKLHAVLPGCVQKFCFGTILKLKNIVKLSYNYKIQE